MTALSLDQDNDDKTIDEWRARLERQEEVVLNLTPTSSNTNTATTTTEPPAATFTVSLQLLRDDDNDNAPKRYICAQLRSLKKTTTKAWNRNRLNQLQQDMIHIADTSFDPVVMINEAGTIVFCNEATESLFQRSKDELMGQSMSILCGGGHGDQHQSYIQRYLQTGVAKKMGVRREVLARKADGTEFPVALGLKEIKHEHTPEGTVERLFVSYMSDLSQIRQHEEELEFREREAQSFIDASFDPMIQIDETGIIQVVNESAVQLFGWSREEFVGSNVSMICGGEHAAQHDGYLRRYLQSGQKHVIGKKRKVPARRKDGSEFTIELGVQQVETMQGDLRFCAFIRDLTEANLMRANMMKQQDLIKDTFFGGGGGAHDESHSAPNTPTGGPSTRSGRPRRLRGASSSIQ